MTKDLADELERLAKEAMEALSPYDRDRAMNAIADRVLFEYPRILSALRGEQDAEGAAERDAGRYIYQRIDTLIDGTSDELKWLAAVVGCVEEYGIEHCRGDELAPFPSTTMTDAQIKHMVDRFLSWKLPENFQPDAGISFDPEFNKDWMASQGKPPMRHKPVGTNLFSADQAAVMVRHMVEGLPKGTSHE